MSLQLLNGSADDKLNSLQVNITNHTNVTELESNVTTIPSDCIQLQFLEFIPWDNPDNIISNSTQILVRNLVLLLILPLCFLLGCPANAINMAVFYRQGLRERINFCLFALAFADELTLLNNMIVYAENFRLLFAPNARVGSFARILSSIYIDGIIYSFIWISQFISAVIASDRCFCVLQPLRAHTILSTSSMAAFIASTSLVIMAMSGVKLTRYHVQCGYDALTGKTMLVLLPTQFYLNYQKLVNNLDGIFFGAALPGFLMFIVTTTTIITIIKLRQAAAWRAATSSSSGLSPAEIAVTKMLISNSFFFLVCVFPFDLVRVTFLFLPEMNVGRRQHNIHMMFIWLFLGSAYINSTFNIFIYYSMGSRYRQTFWRLFKKIDRKEISATTTSTP